MHISILYTRDNGCCAGGAAVGSSDLNAFIVATIFGPNKRFRYTIIIISRRGGGRRARRHATIMKTHCCTEGSRLLLQAEYTNQAISNKHASDADTAL